jgi:hypothetical protein
MRVERVKAARKDQGTCNSCGKPITKGMAYKSISFRYGGTRKRHASCPEFRPSEMTQSKMSGVSPEHGRRLRPRDVPEL